MRVPGPERSRGRALFLAGAVAALALSAGTGTAEESGAVLFSRLAERSWTLQDPVRILTPDNLYEEIDGEAELFLPYDFRNLAVGYLSRKSTAGSQLRLELYRHGSARDAFGIFSQHRFPGQETAAIGPSVAIVSDASLDFFRGERFVRIRAASPGVARGDLLELGRAVSELLEGTGSPPPETEVLQGDGFLPGTLVFQKKAILGYESLAPGYEAMRSSGKSAARMLLLPRIEGVATTPLARVSEGGLPGFARTGPGLYRADLPSGPLWLLEAGDCLLGVSGESDGVRAEALLRDTARRISSNRKETR